jgi:hypothetical protein
MRVLGRRAQCRRFAAKNKRNSTMLEHVPIPQEWDMLSPHDCCRVSASCQRDVPKSPFSVAARVPSAGSQI